MKRVFVNSMPKSGTHLLIKAIQLLGFREHFADDVELDRPDRPVPMFLNYREVKQALVYQPGIPSEPAVGIGTLAPVPVPMSVLERWFDALSPGQFILGHIMADEQLAKLLESLHVQHVLILRDPRAVLVSLLHFISDSRQMPHPHFLREEFKDLSRLEQLLRLLIGGEQPKSGVVTLPFCQAYLRMLDWTHTPGATLVRYEDLVGPSGGGTTHQQRDTFARVAQAIGVETRVTSLLAAQLYDTSTRTFRLGTIDRWRAELDAECLALVQEHCTPLLKAAGYTS